MTKAFWALALALVASIAIPAQAMVNINTATKDELIALSGIGPAKAQAILDYRKLNGPFKSIDDLKNVKGIGAKRLEKLRPELSLTPVTAKVAAAPSKADARLPASGAKTPARTEDTKPVK